MIKTKQIPAAHFIFKVYLKRLLQKHFGGFFLMNEIPQNYHNSSIIFTPNHFSWWDGFFVYYMNSILNVGNLNLMMLEEQLHKYWFFKYVGAYSINPDNIRSVARSLEYTKELLSVPNNIVTIYPQGELLPFASSGLTVKRGIQYLVKENKNSVIIPLAFKICYGEEKKPSVLCRFGRTIYTDSFSQSLFSEHFNSNVAELDKLNPQNASKNLFE